MFLNPLEVLGFSSHTIPTKDEIRKACRIFLVELEFAEDDVDFDGVKYSKAELAQWMESLDDPSKVRAFHRLQKEPELAGFLRTGNPAYFERPPWWVSETDSDLLRVVGPEFAKLAGKAVRKALRASQADIIENIVMSLDWLPEDERVVIRHHIDMGLNEIKDELDLLQGQLKDNKLDVEDLPTKVGALVNPVALNALPPEYRAVRDQIARRIRYLPRSSSRFGGATRWTHELLSQATRLNVSPTIQVELSNQLHLASQAKEVLFLKEEFPREVAACTEATEEVRALIDAVGRSVLTLREVHEQARETVDASVLWEFPSELEPAVDQVADALQDLAVALWNKYKDASVSIDILSCAQDLPVSEYMGNMIHKNITILQEVLTDGMERWLGKGASVQHLEAVVRGMSQPLLVHRGDQIEWSVVSDALAQMFSTNVVAWLLLKKYQQPDQVKSLIQSLAPLLAGLANLRPEGYREVVKRLRPLFVDDPQLETMVSIESVTALASEHPEFRHGTRGPRIWERPWFVAIVVIGLLFWVRQLVN